MIDSPSPPKALADLVERAGIDARFVAPGVPMPTVVAAAAAIGEEPDAILKSLLFAGADGRVVLAIASGTGRVDRSRLATVVGFGPLRLADSETVLRVTGYPAGGVAPLGLRQPVLVVLDRRAAALTVGYAGGGVPEILLQIRIADLVRLTNAMVAEIVVAPEPNRS